nr:hypothetical protein [Candidatus Sigynarchaeota archaeon]
AAIISTPILVSFVQTGCGTATCAAWIFGWIPCTSCEAVQPFGTNFGFTLIMLLCMLFYGLYIWALILSLRVFFKKPASPYIKIKDESTGIIMGSLFIGLVMNVFALFAAGTSVAGWCISAGGLLSYFNSKRLRFDVKISDILSHRLAALEEQATGAIITNKHDALVEEINIICNMATESNSYDILSKAIASREHVLHMASIMNSIRTNKVVSLDSLKAIIKVPDFPAMILDICKKFDLVIKGDAVMIPDDMNLENFLTEIDKMFASWKMNETAKNAKMV